MKIRNTLEYQMKVVERGVNILLKNKGIKHFWGNSISDKLIEKVALYRVDRITLKSENKKLKQQFNTVKNIAQDAITLVKELQDNELKEI